jgi:hypothetical protein
MKRAHGVDPRHSGSFPGSYHLEGCGCYFHQDQKGGCDALVACKKGGIATFWFGERAASDFGWIVRAGNRSWVSHWWADFWEMEPCERGILIKGTLTPHKDNESTPFKHMLLRGMSLVFGRRIIGLLKEKMIFKERQSAQYAFSRKIEWIDEAVRVEDRMQMPEGAVLIRAPRSSKRHVASADSYHREDLMTVDPAILIDENREQADSELVVVTTYRVK